MRGSSEIYGRGSGITPDRRATAVREWHDEGSQSFLFQLTTRRDRRPEKQWYRRKFQINIRAFPSNWSDDVISSPTQIGRRFCPLSRDCQLRFKRVASVADI